MNNEEASPSKNYPSTPSSNDESITTSSESEAFETWTLVTDKKKTKEKSPKPATTIKSTEDENNRIEDLDKLVAVSDKGEVKHKDVKEEQQKIPKPEHDSSTDDLSDGISVISESESAERISPNPYLREQLSNLNLKFASGVAFDTVRPQLTPPNSPLLPTVVKFENNLRQRSRNNDSKTEEIGSRNEVKPVKRDIRTIIQIHPIVRRGLTAMFYVGVALALLAFVGKLRNPEWSALQCDKSVAQLEQRVHLMDLENTMMRVELDSLTKQVDYLTNINDKSGSGKNGQHYKRNDAWRTESKGKKFKNENDIGRDPYECTFDETTSDCVENRVNEKSYVNPNEKVLNEIQSKFAKDNEERFKALQEMNAEWAKKRNERQDDSTKNDNSSEKERKFVDSSKERGSRESNEKHNKSQYHKRRGSHETYDDKDGDDNSDKRFTKRSIKNDKTRFNDNNPKYNKQRRYKASSGERHLKDDSDWHDKLMNQRENARRQNEHQLNEKNWYIKRGDSRERIRVGEMGYR